MAIRTHFQKGIGCAVLVLLLTSPSMAQIEDQLTAYTGKNATGYLQPLADAFGADLNDGLFHSAHITKSGLTFSLEFRVMAVIFSDDARTFDAITESGFSPEQTVEAPTVVGSGEAKIVDGDGGTHYAFPGGFDLNSFTIAAPQLRIGSVYGTEALIRYFSINTGDVEIGNLSLFGFGMRHSISQHFGPEFPVDIAGGFFWQQFKLGENEKGDDLMSANAFSFGVQASKRYAVVLVPYTGLSVDTFSMEVNYESEASGASEDIHLEFETDTTLHWTIGLLLNYSVLNVFGEYNVASQNSFSFGAGFGFGFGM